MCSVVPASSHARTFVGPALRARVLQTKHRLLRASEGRTRKVNAQGVPQGPIPPNAQAVAAVPEVWDVVEYATGGPGRLGLVLEVRQATKAVSASDVNPRQLAARHLF
jgi:hypothetical protein